MPRTATLKKVYIEELKHIYFIEATLADVLPMLAQAASSLPLAQVLLSMAETAENHLVDLESIFISLHETVEACACCVNQFLKKEVEELRRSVQMCADYFLIEFVKTTRVEKIATYERVRSAATQLKQRKAAGIIEAILYDEIRTESSLPNEVWASRALPC